MQRVGSSWASYVIGSRSLIILAVWFIVCKLSTVNEAQTYQLSIGTVRVNIDFPLSVFVFS